MHFTFTLAAVRLTITNAVALLLLGVAAVSPSHAAQTVEAPSSVSAVAVSSPAQATGASAASAGHDTSTPDASTSGSMSPDALSVLQARLPMLRAQKEVAELEKAIRAAKTDAPSSGFMPLPTQPLPPNIGSMTGATPLPTPPATPRAADMVLIGTGSFDGHATATLLSGSVTQDVRVGDVLLGGWRVTRIGADDVELARAGKRRTVRF